MTARVCTLTGTSYHGEGLFAVCVSIRQGERNRQSPSTNRHIPHSQAVCPPQPREEENKDAGAALFCVHKLLDNTETIDKNGVKEPMSIFKETQNLKKLYK